MKAAEKLLLKMRRTKNGYNPSDFKTLYIGFGFECEEGANHTIYIHAKYTHLRATIARHNILATGYAVQAVKLIDELERLKSEGTANE